MSKATKQDIIEDVYQGEFGLTRDKAKDIVNLVFTSITRRLEDGVTVGVHDFGTFKVKEHAAKVGRNPQTGKTLKIPARNVVKFVPAPVVKDAIQ